MSLSFIIWRVHEEGFGVPAFVIKKKISKIIQAILLCPSEKRNCYVNKYLSSFYYYFLVTE